MKRSGSNKVSSSSNNMSEENSTTTVSNETDETDKDNKSSKSTEKLVQPTKEWLFLVTLRIILNLFAQRGYIHPDEFFQGVEVIAGDLFNCTDKIYRPWEFTFSNESAPIRNIAIPYFFYGLPMYFLKMLSQLGAVKDYTLSTDKSESNLVSVQATTLIYYPRMFMTLFSIVVDIVLFNLAELCELDKPSVLVTFASSYIAMIYLTRTFSNSVETILFSVLLYLIIKSIKSQYVLNDKFLFTEDSNNVLSASSNGIKIENKASSSSSSTSPASSPKKRLRLFDIFKYNYLGSYIGLILAVGVFNRPTFIIFSFMPVVYWILYGLENCYSLHQVISYSLRRVFSIGRVLLPVSALLVIIDTAYFYKLTSLQDLLYHINERKLIFAPYNFFLYNSKTENLRTHGEHPIYQHLISCFILFGLNSLIVLLTVVQFFYQLVVILSERVQDEMSLLALVRLKILQLFKYVINNLFSFFVLSFIVPLAVLSLVAHKEPRFLLPLIVPMCLLTNHLVFGNQSYKILRQTWLSLNLTCLLIFGYAHQGGLVPSMTHLQRVFTDPSNIELDQHVIFYHTYMPPRHLIQAPFSVNMINNKRYLYEIYKKMNEETANKIVKGDTGNKTSMQKIYDSIDMPVRQIYELSSSANKTHLHKIILSVKKRYESKKKNYALFLVAPATDHFELYKNRDCKKETEPDLGQQINMNKLIKKNDLTIEKSNKGLRKVSYKLLSSFGFHVAFEHLKEHLELVECRFKGFDPSQNSTWMKANHDCYAEKCRKKSLANRAADSFSLNLYQIFL